jgi:hypothetical protein
LPLSNIIMRACWGCLYIPTQPHRQFSQPDCQRGAAWVCTSRLCQQAHHCCLQPALLPAVAIAACSHHCCNCSRCCHCCHCCQSCNCRLQ